MKLKKEDLKGAIEVIIFFVVVMTALLVFFTMFKFPKTNGYSMLPSFDDGDTMLVLNTRSVEVNDIVVVNSSALGEYIVKRVIGVSGDHIEIREGTLYRNGTPLYEAYLNDDNWCKEVDFVDVVVPDGYIFLLGDNRVVSMDSRAIGVVPTSEIYGKVLCNLTRWDWYLD